MCNSEFIPTHLDLNNSTPTEINFSINKEDESVFTLKSSVDDDILVPVNNYNKFKTERLSFHNSLLKRNDEHLFNIRNSKYLEKAELRRYLMSDKAQKTL